MTNLEISQEKLNNNFIFYYFLKELNSTNIKIKEKEINIFLEKYYLYRNSNYKIIVDIFNIESNSLKNIERQNNIKNLLLYIKNDFHLKLFIFSLKLLLIKPLLLEEAKIININDIITNNNIHPLSLEYDRITRNNPYYIRVHGALLSLIFFKNIEKNNLNFLSNIADNFLIDLNNDYKILLNNKIEPEQIFMLMFSESINQLIKSSAGSNYENRILEILVFIGIKRNKIIKIHDEKDKSTEYDFFFTYKNKKFGISAKRTLRERYKQFIKTSLTTDIDCMIEITLGLDLTEEKANTISQHKVFLFVADEIYKNKQFLQKNPYVFSASNFNLEILEKISNMNIN